MSSEVRTCRWIWSAKDLVEVIDSEGRRYSVALGATKHENNDVNVVMPARTYTDPRGNTWRVREHLRRIRHGPKRRALIDAARRFVREQRAEEAE